MALRSRGLVSSGPLGSSIDLAITLVCAGAIVYIVQQPARAASFTIAGLVRGQQTVPAQRPAVNQTSSASVTGNTPRTAGLESPWDVQKIVAGLVKDNQELKQALTEIHPQQWYEQKGASSTYVAQWTTAQHQVNDVIIASQLLSGNTESLSLALDTYFRLEALEVTARSLDEGAYQYGGRAIADKLSQLIAHNFDNQERFRDYIRDLASNKEQEFKIADQEAQRCRGMISKEPAPGSKRTKRN